MRRSPKCSPSPPSPATTGPRCGRPTRWNGSTKRSNAEPGWSASSPTSPPSSASSAPSWPTCTTNGRSATAATYPKAQWPNSNRPAIMRQSPQSRPATRHRESVESPPRHGAQSSRYRLGLPVSGLLWILDSWGGWCRSSGRRPLKVADAALFSWTLLSTVLSLCCIRRSRSRCQSARRVCSCAGPLGRRSWGSLPLAARQTATSPMSPTSTGTAPALVEAGFYHLKAFRWRGCAVVVGFGFGRGQVPNGFKQATVVPVDPSQGGQLDRVQAAPGALTADQFDLEQANDRFSHRVVVGVANRPDRGLSASHDESFGVTNRAVLFRFKGSSQHPTGPADHTLPTRPNQRIQHRERGTPARCDGVARFTPCAPSHCGQLAKDVLSVVAGGAASGLRRGPTG